MALIPSRQFTPKKPSPPKKDAAPPAEQVEDPNSEFWQAHARLSQIEANRANESSDIHMVHAFGAPKEWRTMSRVPPQLIHLLAGIHARGLRNGSRFRTTLVEDYFLMMRSADGYGSEQMVRVASARNGVNASAEQGRGGFLSGWFGGKPKGP